MTNLKAGLIVLIISNTVVLIGFYYHSLSSITVRPIIAKSHETENVVAIEKTEENAVTRENTDTLQSYVLDIFVGNTNYSLDQNVRFQKRDSQWIPKKHQCPATPENLVGKMKVPVDGNAPSWDEIASQNIFVKAGSSAPKNCTARFRLAIIIPIRDREAHLKTLLYHLHPVLQRQQLDYTIYTISLSGTGIFNRGKLMNAGFVEVNKDREYDCYVFHDVDLLVEDDRCLYWCNENPREIAYHMNKFYYRPRSYELMCQPSNNFPPVNKYFGGVAMVPHNLFVEANGFSNIFWGWGGEDDDMYNRVWSTGKDIVNPYGRMCSFSMIKHEREGTNSINTARFSLLYHSITRMQYEGLNTLRYKRIAVERKLLYVNITVDIGEQSEKMKEFMQSEFSTTPCNKQKMPWEKGSPWRTLFAGPLRYWRTLVDFVAGKRKTATT